MSPPNGQANGSESRADQKNPPAPSAVLLAMNPVSQFTAEKIKELVAELEVPFDPSVIEWRVTNTTKATGKPRGQVIPYADQRAYTDRLNALSSPAGWTRKYTVHTSANFQRGNDEKIVAKVFVTCDLTIFGIGSHSATGEEWAGDENAVTSAEAQAFKRASCCFGLGRYLYHFTGAWVDLDERKRPKTRPKLAGWATPQGWREGLRPPRETDRQSLRSVAGDGTARGNHGMQSGSAPQDDRAAIVHLIEAMAKPLGRGLYRGLLKTVGRVWQPCQIQDIALLQKVFTQMQTAGRGLRRLEAAVAKTGSEPFAAILHSLNLKSLNQVNNLETLQKIVVALESRTDLTSHDA